jgi:hypothetical protein
MKRHIPRTRMNPVAQAATATAILPQVEQDIKDRRAMASDKDKTVAEALIQVPENNKVWDDVNVQSASCHRMLSTPGALLPVLRAPEIKEIIEEQGKKEMLDRTAGVLARDLTQFGQFYQGIRKTHEGREGPSTDPNDHFRAITTFNDYSTYIEQFNANVMPMVEAVGEIAAGAEKVLEERDPEASKRIKQEVQQYLQDRNLVRIQVVEPQLTPEQDPSVISDAVVVN